VNELARASGVTSERLIVEGNPSSDILRIAEDDKIDMIVMAIERLGWKSSSWAA